MRGEENPHFRIALDPSSQDVAGNSWDASGDAVPEIFSVDGKGVKRYPYGNMPYSFKKGKLLAYIVPTFSGAEVRIVNFETDSIVFNQWRPTYGGEGSFSISPDERIVAIGGKQIDLYDIETGQLLRSKSEEDIEKEFYPGPTYIKVTAMLFHPNGKEIFFGVSATYIEPKNIGEQHFILSGI